MNWNESACETPELIRIAERLNKCNESKKMLELELANEEFKYKYIDKRKKLTSEKIKFRMAFIIPVTLIVAICISVFAIGCISIKRGIYNRALLLCMLASVLVLIALGYVYVKLWIPEIKMMNKFNRGNKNIDAESGTITFEQEEKNSKKRINMLRAQVQDLQQEIKLLQAREKEQEALIYKKMAKNESADTKEEFSDDETEISNGKFRIKKEKLGQIQNDELMEYYDRELREYRNNLLRLEAENERLGKNIVDVDADFKQVKERIIIFIVSIAVMSFTQDIFSGVVYQILGVVICIVILVYFFWLVNVCTQPIIMYLVEHNSEIIQDYAYINDLKPISRRKIEIVEEIQECNIKIKEFEEKKRMLFEE